MQGLARVLEACESVVRRGEPAALATIVQVAGSAYRRPGARMLFPSEGPPVGFISGGCLESDLAERAQGVLRSGRAETVVYDMRSPDDIVWGLGLGCNGEVRVLLERLGPGALPDYLERILAGRRRRESLALATVFGTEGAGLSVGDREVLADCGEAPSGPAAALDGLRGDLERALRDGRSAVKRYESAGTWSDVLIEHLPPPMRLAVFGAGSDAQPLVRIAGELGWEVTVFDHRPVFASPERFPEAAAVRCVDFDELSAAGVSIDDRTPMVVMTHHFLNDATLLSFLHSTPAPYVGVIGPKQRRENLMQELDRRGVRMAPEHESKIFGPVGLDIGSETPEEIALSILSEIVAVLSGRRGGSLRDRGGPLHDWPE
ncbi:MAG: XdhC family protein [bacterium]|nr:XdhC family protein [bacterium]